MQFLHQLTVIHPALLSRPATTVKIENVPYLSLTVENIGLGPRGLPALSICHYGELNGDLMRDPEMCFEMEIENGAVKDCHPFYFSRRFHQGREQFSQRISRHGPDRHRAGPVHSATSLGCGAEPLKNRAS